LDLSDINIIKGEIELYFVCKSNSIFKGLMANHEVPSQEVNDNDQNDVNNGKLS